MEAKEQAKRLIEKFQEKEIIEYTRSAYLPTVYSRLNNREAIECAIICVNEMLLICDKLIDSEDGVDVYNSLIATKKELVKLK